MMRIKFVSLDVHAETISVAVAEHDGENKSGMFDSLPVCPLSLPSAEPVQLW